MAGAPDTDAELALALAAADAAEEADAAFDAALTLDEEDEEQDAAGAGPRPKRRRRAMPVSALFTHICLTVDNFFSTSDEARELFVTRKVVMCKSGCGEIALGSTMDRRPPARAPQRYAQDRAVMDNGSIMTITPSSCRLRFRRMAASAASAASSLRARLVEYSLRLLHDGRVLRLSVMYLSLRILAEWRRH